MAEEVLGTAALLELGLDGGGEVGRYGGQETGGPPMVVVPIPN